MKERDKDNDNKAKETNFAVVEVEPGKEKEKKRELNKREDIRAATLNHYLELNYIPNDPEAQNGHQNDVHGGFSNYGIRDYSLWSQNRTWAAGQWANIAILDSGFDMTRPDLKAALPHTGKSKIQDYYDFCGQDYDVTSTEPHGTHMASLASGYWDNSRAIAGVAPLSQLYLYKVTCDATPGSPDEGSVIEAIKWAGSGTSSTISHVINMSFSTDQSGYDQNFQDAVTTAYNNGSHLIASANQDENLTYYTLYPYTYPASYTHVNGVAWALDNQDATSVKSKCGSHVDFSAPGESNYMETNGGGIVVFSGTSNSAAIASGLSAILCAGYGIGPQQRADHMAYTAKDLDDGNPNNNALAPGPDSCSGYGRIDSYNAAWLNYPV